MEVSLEDLRKQRFEPLYDDFCRVALYDGSLCLGGCLTRRLGMLRDVQNCSSEACRIVHGNESSESPIGQHLARPAFAIARDGRDAARHCF
jgi:hypothetical protein